MQTMPLNKPAMLLKAKQLNSVQKT